MADPDSIIKELEQSLLQNPENYDARVELATNYMMKGDYYTAAAELQKVVKNNPPSQIYIDSYYQLGVILRTLGNFSESLKCIEKVLEVDSSNGNAFYYAGLLYSETGQPQKASESLRKAIDILSQQSYLYYALGNAELQAGNYDKAIEVLKTALELDPKDVQARNALGLSYIMKKDYGKSSDEIGESLKLNPKDPTAIFLYVLTNIHRDEEIEALEYIERFVRDNSSNSLGYLTLSALHYLVGEYSEGKEAHKKGLDLLEAQKDPIYSSALEVISSSLVEVSDEKEILEEDEKDFKFNLMRILQEIIGLKDPILKEKSKLISILAKKMGQTYGEFDDSDLENIEIAGGLCNIGMALLPDSIIRKEEKLSDEEKKILTTHPLLSVKVLEKVEFLTDLLPYIKHHHERCNGTGYPERLKEEDIPMGAAILGVADFYAELTLGSKRQRPAARPEVLNTINTLKGNFFSRKVVDLLNKTLSGEKK